jgi:hypothetical protein
MNGANVTTVKFGYIDSHNGRHRASLRRAPAARYRGPWRATEAEAESDLRKQVHRSLVFSAAIDFVRYTDSSPRR